MTRPINILELRSVRGTGGGPDKTILLGAARADRRRFAVTVCYLRDARDRVFEIDRHARAADVDYVEVIERHSFDPSIWPALRRLVRARRIDIVHAHEHKSDLLALSLAKVEGIAPLATAHGWSGDTWRERAYYFFDRRLLARYPMVIAVSERIRQTLVAHGAPPASVRRIPNGIDHVRFRRDPACRARLRPAFAIPSDAIVIGSVGRLERVKRFDVLFEAAVRLQTRRPLWILLAGDGSRGAELRRRAADLGLGDRVRFCGHQVDPAASITCSTSTCRAPTAKVCRTPCSRRWRSRRRLWRPTSAAPGN